MSSKDKHQALIGPGFSTMTIVVALILLSSVANAESDRVATEAAHSNYSDTVANQYNYRFGNGHPFLPSNIQTYAGQFLNSKDFPRAQYCGHCHQEAHAQWRQSAHSNATGHPGISRMSGC
jgi:hypothetical protein